MSQRSFSHMTISILFRPKNRVRDKIFRTFRESFSNFSPSRKFCRRPKIFQILADSAAIRLVQKSSKSEPSSKFFSRLKFRGKFVPCELLQNFLCGYKIEMATYLRTTVGRPSDDHSMAVRRPSNGCPTPVRGHRTAV